MMEQHVNDVKPLTRKQAWEKELEVPPESVVSFESQAGPLETEGPMFFIVQDLKKQAWVFCNQQGIQFDTLEWGEISKAPKDEKKPKGPWKFFIRAETPTPRTLGQTAFTVAVEYQYMTLVYRGILEGDAEDKEVVEALKAAEAQREAERLKLLEQAAKQGVATQTPEQSDAVAAIEQIAKEKGLTVEQLLAVVLNTKREPTSDKVDKEDNKQ